MAVLWVICPMRFPLWKIKEAWCHKPFITTRSRLNHRDVRENGFDGRASLCRFHYFGFFGSRTGTKKNLSSFLPRTGDIPEWRCFVISIRSELLGPPRPKNFISKLVLPPWWPQNNCAAIIKSPSHSVFSLHTFRIVIAKLYFNFSDIVWQHWQLRLCVIKHPCPVSFNFLNTCTLSNLGSFLIELTLLWRITSKLEFPHFIIDRM